MTPDAAPLSSSLLLLAVLGGSVGAVGQFLFNRAVVRVSVSGVIGVVLALGVLAYLLIYHTPTFALPLTFVPTAMGGLARNVLRQLSLRRS